MKLRNPQGRVVAVTPSMFQRYRTKKGWSEIEKETPVSDSFPVRDETGSWYTLSNGDRVNGKENAIKAEKALHG